MEGETEASIKQQLSVFHERVLLRQGLFAAVGGSISRAHGFGFSGSQCAGGRTLDCSLVAVEPAYSSDTVVCVAGGVSSKVGNRKRERETQRRKLSATESNPAHG